MKLSTQRHLAFLASLVTCAGLAGAQSTWVVDGTAVGPGTGTMGDPFASIQFAIDQATTVDGDTVLVLPGSYDPIDFKGKAITVESSAGATSTIIDGGTTQRCVTFQSSETSDSVLRGFTVSSGFDAADGGGIYIVAASPLIVECFVLGNKSVRGGGVFARNSSVEIRRCSILNNEGVSGAGLFFVGGSPRVAYSSIIANVGVGGLSISANGKGVWSGESASLVLDHVEITDHASSGTPERGGGVYVDSGSAELISCEIARNRLGPDMGTRGAGLYVESGANVDVTSSHFERNVGADFGGGIFGDADASGTSFENNSALEGGGVFGGTYFRCTFEGNTASGDPTLGGGGAACQASLRQCRLLNNGARVGGGAYLSTVQDGVVIGNVAQSATPGSAEGGGVAQCQVQGSELMHNRVVGGSGGGASRSDLTDCRVNFNEADVNGGGANGGSMVDCEVRGNRLQGDNALAGGGLYQVTATGCEVTRNAALSDMQTTYGGGAARSVLARTVLFSNQADIGGGTWQSEHDFSTIAMNRAYLQGGGSSDATTGMNDQQVLIRNSIVWGNVPDQIDAPAMASPVDWSTVEGGWPGTGNTSADPAFVGPRSGDLHIGFGSSAIDTADPSTMDGDGSRGDQGALPFDAAYVAEPANFCEESTGSCSAKIGYAGMPTLSGADDFKLNLSGIPAQSAGFLVLGSDTTPIFSRPRCVSGVVAYIPLTSSGGTTGCTGGYDVLVDQTVLNMLAPGSTGYIQFAFQDPALPGGCGYSDGLEFTVLP